MKALVYTFHTDPGAVLCFFLLMFTGTFAQAGKEPKITAPFPADPAHARDIEPMEDTVSFCGESKRIVHDGYINPLKSTDNTAVNPVSDARSVNSDTPANNCRQIDMLDASHSSGIEVSIVREADSKGSKKQLRIKYYDTGACGYLDKDSAKLLYTLDFDFHDSHPLTPSAISLIVAYPALTLKRKSYIKYKELKYIPYFFFQKGRNAVQISRRVLTADTPATSGTEFFIDNNKLAGIAKILPEVIPETLADHFSWRRLNQVVYRTVRRASCNGSRPL